MRRDWNGEDWECKCPSCNYVYLKNKKEDPNNLPFLPIVMDVFYKKQSESPWNDPIIQNLTLYACPECGTVQIDLSELY